MKLFRKLRALFAREKLDAEMAEEMRAHLEQQTAVNQARGMNAEEAAYAARRQFGGVEQIKETAREQRGVVWLEQLLRDIFFAARSLRKNPGFTLVSVLIAAIGIGAATAMFSTVNALVLRPLPLAEPERVMALYETNLARNVPLFAVSIPNYMDWKVRSRSWVSLAAVNSRAMNLTGDGEPELVEVPRITANFLSTLGLSVMHGRDFREDEDRPGHNQVALISAGFWQRRFGGTADAIGETLALDGVAYTIVGVTTPGAGFADDFAIAIPLAADVTREDRLDHYLSVYGRLKIGVAMEQADAEMKALAAQTWTEFPNLERGWSTRLMPLAREVVGDGVRTGVFVLLGAVGVLLLIACANLSNLMLVRASSRGHELAVRTALGADRWRVIRQLVTESLVVTMLGGSLGVLLGVWSIEGLRVMPLPRAEEISIDLRVLSVACGVTILTGLLGSIGPALKASQVRPQEALKGKAPRLGGGSRARDSLVVAQLALSLTLLIAAALLVRSFRGLLQVDPGFKTERVLTLSLRPSGRAVPFYDEVVTRVGAFPEVAALGLISRLPLTTGSTSNFVSPVGPSLMAPEDSMQANWRLIHGNYFGAMQIPLLRGRDFSSLAPDEARRSMVISASLAKAMWGDEDPIGRQIKRIGALFTVIGVVGDVRSERLGMDPIPALYMSIHRFTYGPQALVVRAKGDAPALLAMIRQTIKEIDASVPLFQIQTMDELRSANLDQQRLMIALLGGFAGVALLLAALGTYGVAAFAVQQRTREIGVRIAVGARGGHICRMILGQTARLAVAGVVIGLVGALVVARVLSALLYNVSSTDMISYAIATLALGFTALLAALLPASRAAKIDPIIALRGE